VITRLGLGGPGITYGVIAAKSAAAVVTVAARITRMGMGGPAANYGAFGAKSAADSSGSFDFIVMARRRGRR
jgi:hypothetical protein